MYAGVCADFAVMPDPVETVAGTTAAGDPFNAGYLAAMAKGQSDDVAASFGARTAAVVIQGRGALVDVSPLSQD